VGGPKCRGGNGSVIAVDATLSGQKDSHAHPLSGCQRLRHPAL